MRALQVVGAGLLISWLGALPLGVLNITALDISAMQGFQAALLFAVAAIVIELFYVRLSLLGSKKWILNKQWIAPFLLFGGLLLLYLSLANLLGTSETQSTYEKQGWIGLMGSPMLLGFLLSATNPLQFPFWLTWNKVLFHKKILRHNMNSYLFYMLGIGLGTFLALLLFILMGASLVVNYQVYANYSKAIMAVLYLGFSLYIFYLFYKRLPKPIKK